MTSNPHERAFEWTEDKIRWYGDASVYHGNDRTQKIAAALLAELPDRPRVCDVGCGVGFLSLELAKGAREVLSLELNENALAALQNEIKKRSVVNITPLQADFDTQAPVGEPFDGMVLCMFGGMFEYVAVAERWLSKEGKTFFITGTSKRRCFSANGVASSNDSLDDMRRYLADNGFKWSESIIPTSFGQPLTSVEEARRFMRAYDKLSTDDEIARDLEKRLFETGEREFPLYLPADKEYIMFMISRR